MRLKDTSNIYAMKILNKWDMLKRQEVGKLGRFVFPLFMPPWHWWHNIVVHYLAFAKPLKYLHMFISRTA